jgi:threonine dehydrogenase-like Zn-dependent dehydrogenase
VRAAIFRNGEIVVDEMAEPKPGLGMVLVKSLACGICGSDLHARKHAHRMVELARFFPGRKPMDLSRDLVFGHEFCCECSTTPAGARSSRQKRRRPRC